MLARRGFLVGLLAAPSIVSAASIMRVAPYSIIWGDGIHDDTAAIQRLIDRGDFFGQDYGAGRFRISRGLHVPCGRIIMDGHFIGTLLPGEAVINLLPDAQDVILKDIWFDMSLPRHLHDGMP